MASLVRLLVVVSVCLCAIAFASEAQARAAGLASSLFLGRTPPSCNSCHSGGVAPSVSLTSSASTLEAGQQITLTFTVTTPNGNPGAAGFNLRSSQQGTFAVGGPSSANTRVLSGTSSWSEATHTARKAGEPATFTVLWTPSAGTDGDVIFTAWGNAVNANGFNSGDQAASDTVTVTVQSTICSDTFFRDLDGDGYGSAASGTITACLAPPGYVDNGTDCNDASSAIHPGASEVCNGVDDNCVGGVDNGLPASTFYRDADGDSFGSAATTRSACSLAVAGSGFVTNGTDCNDGDRNIYPGAPEICANGKDDNCNNVVDTDAPTSSTFYRDADGDGYGASASGTATACAPPTGYVSRSDDCSDGDRAVFPSAPELCDGHDNDCDSTSDEGFGNASCGIGECARTVAQCSQGTPQTCVPGTPSAEICNGKDDDCNDHIDEGCNGGDAGGGDAGTEDAGNDATPDAALDAGSDAPAPPADAPATGSGGGPGRPPPSDSGAGASPPADPDSPPGSEDSGCGCRTPASDARGLSLLLLSGLFALGFFARRRFR